MTISLTCPYAMANQKKTQWLWNSLFHILTKASQLSIGHNYFKNPLKATVACWLDSWSTFNRDEVLEWENVKPHFQKAFGDKIDPMVYASTIFDIKLANFNDSLYEYTNTITKVLMLHTEKFLTTHLSFVANHRLTAAQLLQQTKDLNTHRHAIHDDFQKEFFIWGLSQKNKKRI